MSRYYVAPAAQLELVRQAINDGALGPHASRMYTLVRNGIAVQVNAAAEEARLGVEPEQVVHTSCLVIAGRDAALELPETAHVSAQLGKTVGGTSIPSVGALVQVARPRDNSLLPAGVRDVLDDRYVAQLLVEDTPAARAAITAELQGARAAAALARWDAPRATGADSRRS